jgi:hypothetical protein
MSYRVELEETEYKSAAQLDLTFVEYRKEKF